MRHLIGAVLIVTSLVSPAPLAAQADTGRLGWVPNPRRSYGGWVADPARHLRPATVTRIDSIVSRLERETTAEIGVAVLDSLSGLEPADAALRLHRQWGVGKANRDNGIVLLWSPALRRIQISVGYGLEGVLPDARAGRIEDEAMLPAFRRNDFDGGMVSGVQALAGVAREETYSGLGRNAAARPAIAAGGWVRARFGGDRDPGHSQTGAGTVGVISLAAAVPLLLVVAGLKLRRRRPRRCSQGHSMHRLDEATDDALLAKEEVLEEKLESIDYDVWLCDHCGERRSFRTSAGSPSTRSARNAGAAPAPPSKMCSSSRPTNRRG